MKHSYLALALCSGLALTAPAQAQDVGNIIQGVAQGLINQELERAAYQQAQRTNTLAGWQAFLQAYPNGANRSNAQRALERLGGNVQVPAPNPTPVNPTPVTPTPVTPTANSGVAAEQALGLSRDQRRTIQAQLTAAGYNAGTPDGLWGTTTRDAIRRWQRANNVEVTGYVNARQVQQIAAQGGNVTPTPTPNPNVATDQQEEQLLGLTLAERREIQTRLMALGYNTRGADGVFGQNTRNAIAGFQRDNSASITGYITADQLRALRSQTPSVR
ncbi:peptidoglycan-binding protein [Ketogulonicigenium vulgare]|uniref:peptidoglycan-binding domain-containing protein n=1 Tax=Ketogulonicigenium vulgare TaxID=92945 RepID=UPI00235977E2|nr:peptidoglycan-binding domain-containing protein [Ketogulonicigenium vulgare]